MTTLSGTPDLAMSKDPQTESIRSKGVLTIPPEQKQRIDVEVLAVYQREMAISNNAKIIPGCDFRGDGGYVVVPPSINEDGKGYTWLEREVKGCSNFL